MKKFAAYLVLALLVYALIYALLLGYMRFKSKDIRMFCEQLTTGMSKSDIELAARNQGLLSAVNTLADQQGEIIFISRADAPDTACQGLIENGQLTHKKFVLSVF